MRISHTANRMSTMEVAEVALSMISLYETERDPGMDRRVNSGAIHRSAPVSESPVCAFARRVEMLRSNFRMSAVSCIAQSDQWETRSGGL